MLLTEILNLFLDKLSVIPKNLTNSALALLMTFTVLDISLQIFKVDEIDWQKWIVKKTVKTGILIWLIKNYIYIVKEIKEGFISIGTIAIGYNNLNSNYLYSPSAILDKGISIAIQFKEAITWNPETYIFIIISIIIVVGFCFMAFEIIITWIEFYLLTGLSIIFIPFGAIKMGENYYTNVFKTIVGCSIKLCILNVILLLSEKILLGLVVTKISFQTGIVTSASIGILAYLTLSIPALATAMLTGSPTMSANEALRTGMMGVSTAMRSAMMMKNVANNVVGGTAGAVGGTLKGGTGGARTGGNICGQIGGAVGGLFGPTGAAIGTNIGKGIGSTGGALIGGAYSGTKLGLQGAKGGIGSVASSLGKSKAGSSSNSSPADASTGSNSNSSPADTSTGSSSNSSPTDTSTGSNSNSSPTDASTGSNSNSSPADTSTGSSSNSSPTDASTGSNSNSSPTDASTGSNSNSSPTGSNSNSSPTGSNSNSSPTGSSSNSSPTNTSTGSNKKETTAPFLKPRSNIAETGKQRESLLNGQKVNLKDK